MCHLGLWVVSKRNPNDLNIIYNSKIYLLS